MPPAAAPATRQARSVVTLPFCESSAPHAPDRPPSPPASPACTGTAPPSSDAIAPSAPAPPRSTRCTSPRMWRAQTRIQLQPYSRSRTAATARTRRMPIPLQLKSGPCEPNPPRKVRTGSDPILFVPRSARRSRAHSLHRKLHATLHSDLHRPRPKVFPCAKVAP